MIDLRVVRPLQPSIVAKKVHSDCVIPLPEVVCPNMGQHFSDENHDGSSGMRMVRPFYRPLASSALRRVSRRAFNSVNEASTSSYITQDLQSLMKVLPYMDYTSLYPEIMRVISTATLGQEVASRL